MERRSGLRPRQPRANYEEVDLASVRSEPTPRIAPVIPALPDDPLELEAAIEREEAELQQRRQAANIADRQEHLRALRRERALLDVRPLRPHPPTAQKQRPSRPRRQSASSGSDAEQPANNLQDLRQIRELQDLANRRTDDVGLFDRSSGSDSSSDGRRTRGGRRRRGRKIKSGKHDKISSHVKHAERWPHAYVASSQCGAEERAYEDLTIQEFVAGFATILGLRELPRKEREERTAHLSQLMYLAQIYEWGAVLSFHAAVLQQIERGSFKWGDTLAFAQLESRTLAGRFLQKELGSRTAQSTIKGSARTPAVTWASSWGKSATYYTYVRSACVEKTG